MIGSKDCPPNTTDEEAMKYVAGFCVVNDVSSRGLCGKGGAGQWGMGKNYDCELFSQQRISRNGEGVD